METNRLSEQLTYLNRRLHKDLYTERGILLLTAGTRLTESDLRYLAVNRIDLTPDDVEEPAAHPLHQDLEDAMRQAEAIFDEVRHTKRVPISDVRKHMLPVINEAAHTRSLLPLMQSLLAKDDYTYRHTIAVGVISTMLGVWLALDDKQLSLLTIGATLHDVGKMLIPEEILNKEGKLTDAEYEIMKKHALYGYEMLRGTTGLAWRSALIALQHHEREDGSGYPLGIEASRIDPLGKMVAIADVFHAMSSDRPYRKAAPFYEILNRMYQGTLGRFEPHMLQVFTRQMLVSLVGSEVALNDGREGRVVLVPPQEPTRPLVQIGNAFVDLKKESELEIVRIVG